MAACLRQVRGIAIVSVVSAALLVTGSASQHGQAFAGQSFSQLKADVKKVHATGHQLAAGTLKDYPKHLLHAIKRRPLRYVAGLMTIGVIGAGAKAIGIDPAPFMVALSLGTLGFAWYKSAHHLKGLEGPPLARATGAHVIGPG